MNNPAIYIVPYLISLSISLVLGAYAVGRRKIPGAIEFAAMMAVQASMTSGFILELLAPDLEGKAFWDNFQFLGMFLVPGISVLFARAYTSTGRTPGWQTWLMLVAVPAALMALVYTDPYHGLIRSEVRLEPDQPFDELAYSFTPLSLALIAYTYLVAVYALSIFGRTFGGVRGFYRSQMTVIFMGLLVPFVGGALTLAEIRLTPYRDSTPLMFAIGNTIIAWGLFRYRLLDIVPVARELVFEDMADPVVVIDNDDRIVDINAAVRRYVKTSKDDVIGKRAIDVFPSQENTERVLLMLPGTIEFLAADRQTYFQVHLSLIKDKHGRQIGRVAVFRDITERKGAEEALSRAREESEAARRKAEEADQVKTRFLASMSHELRTPLNGVLSLVEMVSHEMFGGLNDRQKAYLAQAIDSGEHLLSLINDILDINKIQAGMLSLFMEEVDIREELQQVVHATQALIRGKPIRLVTDIDPDLPRLTCDRRRLKQVLINLSGNAAKFTESGTITLSTKYSGNQEILFGVSDTGPGIRFEDQALIFEPFVQAENGKAKPGSTGLGLPISRYLVEAHGGRLWLESEPGDGATFFFTVPLREATHLAQEAEHV